jgi:hypothetical protein
VLQSALRIIQRQLRESGTIPVWAESAMERAALATDAELDTPGDHTGQHWIVTPKMLSEVIDRLHDSLVPIASQSLRDETPEGKGKP